MNRSSTYNDRYRAAYAAVEADEVLRALRSDPASAEHADARVREIIEDVMLSEREARIRELEADNQAKDAELNEIRVRYDAYARNQHRILEERNEFERTLVALRRQVEVDGANKERVESELRRALDLVRETMAKDANASETTARLQREANALKQRLEEEVERGKQAAAGAERLQAYAAEQKRKAKKLAAELEAASATLAKSEKERLELRAKYLALGEKVEAVLRTEERENAESVMSLQRKVKDLKSRLASEEKEAAKMKRQVAELEAKAEAKARAAGELQEQNASMQGKLERYRARLQAELSTKETEQRAYKGRISDLENELARLSQILAGLRFDVEKQATESIVETERQLRSSYEARAREVESALLSKATKESELATALGEERARGRAAEERADAEAAARRKAEAALAEERRALGELQKAAERLEEEAAGKRRAEALLAEERRSRQELQARLDDLDRAKRLMAAHIEEGGSNLARLRRMAEEEQSRRKSFQAEVEESRAAADRLASRNEELAARNEELSARCGELGEVNGRLADALQKVKEAHRAAAAAEAAARGEADSLRLQVASARGEADSLRAQIAALHSAAERGDRAAAVNESTRSRLVALRAQVGHTRDQLRGLRSKVVVDLATVADDSARALQDVLQQHRLATMEQARRTREDLQRLQLGATVEMEGLRKASRSQQEAEERAAQLAAKLSAATLEVDRARAERLDWENERRQLDGQVRGLQAKRAHFAALLGALSEHVALPRDVQEGLLSMSKDVYEVAMQRANELLARFLADRENRAASMVNIAKDTAAKREADLRTAQRELESANRQIGELKSAIGELQTQLRSTRAEAEERVERVRQETGVLGELARVEAIAPYRAELASLRTQVEELSRQYDTELREREAAVQRDLKGRLDQTTAALQAELERARKGQAESREREKQLSEQLADVKGQLDSARRDAEMRKREQKQWEEVANSNQRKIQEETARLEELRRRLEEKERQLQEQERRKEQLKRVALSKDNELAEMHSLLEKSFSQVSLDGIRAADQLESETIQLSRRVGSRTPASNLAPHTRSHLRLSSDGRLEGRPERDRESLASTVTSPGGPALALHFSRSSIDPSEAAGAASGSATVRTPARS
eukprot:tig00000383_g24624.t1